MSLMIESNIIIVFITILSSIATYVVSLKKKKEEQENLKIESNKLKRKVEQISVDLGLVNFTHSLEANGERLPQDEILAQLETSILKRLKEHPGYSDDAIKSTVKQDLVDFKERILRIENRFPDESNFEKFSSINDALLAERIDQIKERLVKIEETMLSRWDIAKIVSAIIGGISFVAGATYGIIKYIETA